MFCLYGHFLISFQNLGYSDEEAIRAIRAGRDLLNEGAYLMLQQEDILVNYRIQSECPSMGMLSQYFYRPKSGIPDFKKELIE